MGLDRKGKGTGRSLNLVDQGPIERRSETSRYHGSTISG